MSFVDTENQYYRTTIVINHFNDGAQELVKYETDFVHPPCVGSGCGCRASSFDQKHCKFDPKTGLCDGKMP